MPSHSIIDSHVHLTDPARLRYPWLRDAPALDRAWTVPDLMDAAAPVVIDRLVFVEVDVHPDDRLEEARFVAGLAAQDSRIAGMVASLPMERGMDIGPDLDRMLETGIVVGIRRLIQSEADPDFCTRPDFLASLRLLGARDVPFDICCYHHQLPAVARMVRACPQTRFVLDHLGKPAVRDGRLDPWRADLDSIAACPNVSCKISGLATEAHHDAWSRGQLLPYIRHALAAFGDGRVMFGGDWFVATMAIDYPDWVGVLDAALEGWPDDARRRFWGGTAAAFYLLDGDAS